MANFRNPVADRVQVGRGVADPSVFRHTDNFYYYARKLPNNQLTVCRAKRLQDIGAAPGNIVWTPPTTGLYSTNVWAPVIRPLNGTWYIYFAADDGNNYNHRMHVISCATPMGNYSYVGKVSDSTDRWAIDGVVLQDGAGALFFVWSGWANAWSGADQDQHIYIAGMSNPTTINTPRVLLSSPTFAWERIGAPPGVNEAPAILVRGSTYYIVYTCSGSWTDDYALNTLTYNGGGMLNASSWVKNTSGPVMTKQATAYGPGSCCFTKSPNGTEDWILYHANRVSGTSWGGRSVRAQKLNSGSGAAMFPVPSAYNDWVTEPAGTIASICGRLEAEAGVRTGAATINTQTASAGKYVPSGGKVVGNINSTADSVTFTVTAPSAGNYLLIVSGSNGSVGGDSKQSVIVNGASAGTVLFPKMGWQVFTTQGIFVNLNAGSNSIKLTQNTYYAEVDFIECVPNF